MHISALYKTDGNLYDSTTFSDELVNTLTELELKDRKSYCSPKVIGGKTYASPQEALAFFVGQVMGKPASESSQFATALINSIMENNGILKLYDRLRNFNS